MINTYFEFNALSQAKKCFEVIYGNEYSCECISYKGKHNYLTITKKYTTGFKMGRGTE